MPEAPLRAGRRARVVWIHQPRSLAARPIAVGREVGPTGLDREVDRHRNPRGQRERRLLDRAVRWLVSNRRSPIDVAGEVERLRPGVSTLLPQLPGVMIGDERESLDNHVAYLIDLGVPEKLAERTARIVYGFGLLDILETAKATGRDIREVAEVYFVISCRFHIDELLDWAARDEQAGAPDMPVEE